MYFEKARLEHEAQLFDIPPVQRQWLNSPDIDGFAVPPHSLLGCLIAVIGVLKYCSVCASRPSPRPSKYRRCSSKLNPPLFVQLPFVPNPPLRGTAFLKKNDIRVLLNSPLCVSVHRLCPSQTPPPRARTVLFLSPK